MKFYRIFLAEDFQETEKSSGQGALVREVSEMLNKKEPLIPRRKTVLKEAKIIPTQVLMKTDSPSDFCLTKRLSLLTGMTGRVGK